MSVHRLIGASGYSPACAVLPGIANPAGSRDEPVTVTISNLTDQYGNGLLPSNYAVAVTTGQSGVTVAVGSKTTSGFQVTLSALTGNVAAGTFDAIVIAP
jgi:hypothetical protein